ncbi:hypothetical protein Tco_0002394 [Tanacetum coccineum]
MYPAPTSYKTQNEQNVPRSQTPGVIPTSSKHSTAFSKCPTAIYLQQFLENNCRITHKRLGFTIESTGEQGSIKVLNLLRKALAITPVNPAHPFELPPSGDTVIDFVNELGYPEPVEIVSRKTSAVTNPTHQFSKAWNRPLKTKGFNMMFGMAIPDPLITEAIQRSSYYPMYMKMVAENSKKTPQGSANVTCNTACSPKKSYNHHTRSKQTKQPPSSDKKPSKRKLPQKLERKPAFQLVDEEDELTRYIPSKRNDDPDLETG